MNIFKRILSLSAAAVMMLTCASSAVFADESPKSGAEASESTEDSTISKTKDLIFDYANLLSTNDKSNLFNKLETISLSNKVDIAVATVENTGGEELTNFTMQTYLDLGLGGDEQNSGILICYSVEDKDWQVAADGVMLDVFTDEGFANMEQYLETPFASGDIYTAFDRYGSIMEAFLLQSKQGNIYKNELRVVDRGDIIDEDKEAELLKMCDEISERQGVEVVIITEKSIGNRTSQAYIDDYYDYSGFGLDDKRSGIAFLISMENRDWAFSTTGDGIPYFTDAGQSYIISEIKGYLSDGDYYKAFDLYARLCDNFITEAKDNRPFDSGHLPEHSLRPYSEVAFGRFIVICPVSIVIAFLIWLIICCLEKAKLTSVSFKGQADDYIKRDSIVINKRNDTFLYKNTTKRYNPPSESSSSGGSSSHSSSSGSSHGGSSGHF